MDTTLTIVCGRKDNLDEIFCDSKDMMMWLNEISGLELLG